MRGNGVGGARPVRAFEAAVPAGEDPGRWARVLRRVRDPSLTGPHPPAAPRPLIDDSWQRTRRYGMDPDVGRDLPLALGPDEVEHRRRSGHLRRPTLAIESPSGRWSHRLSPRHAELLVLLALAADGRTSVELSPDLLGAGDRAVTIRAELSRLRRHLGGLLLQRPYRFADWVDVRLHRPETSDDLLPASMSPAIRRIRAQSTTGVNA